MEENLSALEREADISTANAKLKEVGQNHISNQTVPVRCFVKVCVLVAMQRSLSVLEDEHNQLSIHANGLQEQLSRGNGASS